jgi:hypothetical protein
MYEYVRRCGGGGVAVSTKREMLMKFSVTAHAAGVNQK